MNWSFKNNFRYGCFIRRIPFPLTLKVYLFSYALWTSQHLVKLRPEKKETSVRVPKPILRPVIGIIFYMINLSQKRGRLSVIFANEWSKFWCLAWKMELVCWKLCHWLVFLHMKYLKYSSFYYISFYDHWLWKYWRNIFNGANDSLSNNKKESSILNALGNNYSKGRIILNSILLTTRKPT